MRSNQARPERIGPGHICVQTKDAAARRATRRLPLGEPPLVVTTHAITSYTTRVFPVPRESSLEQNGA
jgi:hypothetical protein